MDNVIHEQNDRAFIQNTIYKPTIFELQLKPFDKYD